MNIEPQIKTSAPKYPTLAAAAIAATTVVASCQQQQSMSTKGEPMGVAGGVIIQPVDHVKETK